MRNMSFMLTQRQITHRTKTVTRRNGWWFLKAGDLLQAVNKAQGLKKGEHPIKLCVIRVERVTREPLSNIDKYDLIREGFPELSMDEFIDLFCKSHKGVTPQSYVNRIEFSYVDEVQP
jgi:hypothetical protein